MINRRPSKLESLAEELFHGDAAPPAMAKCPECGGNLIIHHSTYRRQDRTMLGLGVRCLSCGSALELDGLAPDWASTEP
jgi:predicted RNA-binding Zn-ribbon protein involved in translation (DUF1610 family)